MEKLVSLLTLSFRTSFKIVVISLVFLVGLSLVCFFGEKKEKLEMTVFEMPKQLVEESENKEEVIVARGVENRNWGLMENDDWELMGSDNDWGGEETRELPLGLYSRELVTDGHGRVAGVQYNFVRGYDEEGQVIMDEVIVENGMLQPVDNGIDLMSLGSGTVRIIGDKGKEEIEIQSVIRGVSFEDTMKGGRFFQGFAVFDRMTLWRGQEIHLIVFAPEGAMVYHHVGLWGVWDWRRMRETEVWKQNRIGLDGFYEEELQQRSMMLMPVCLVSYQATRWENLNLEAITKEALSKGDFACVLSNGRKVKMKNGVNEEWASKVNF